MWWFGIHMHVKGYPRIEFINIIASHIYLFLLLLLKTFKFYSPRRIEKHIVLHPYSGLVYSAIKGMNYSYTKQYGQISQGWCFMKETRQRVVFLYDFIYISQTDQWEREQISKSAERSKREVLHIHGETGW